MSLQFIEGGAGTGKTTTVIERIGLLLATSPLGEQQRVLALTKMHGSRRRVRERLRGVAGLNGRFESITIDSFAWHLITRWRSLARALGTSKLPSDFDARCSIAGKLLENPCVQKWVAASFPIVVVDELQDSKASQLLVLKGLCAQSRCIAAGDPFQDLEGEDACPSVEWARERGKPTVLETTHRTDNAGLLAAATALRNGHPVAALGGFGLIGVAAPPLGAWHVASRVSKWKHLGTVAVITPVGAARSVFVRKVVERVNGEQPFSTQWWNTADVKLQWEAAQDAQVEATCCALGLPDDDEQLVGAEDLVLDGDARVCRVRAWLVRQRRLFGRREFRVGDLRAAVREAVHQWRLYSRR